MKRFLALIFLICITLPCFASIENIQLNKLPNDSAFRSCLQEFITYEKYVNHYTPQWNYPIPKSTLVLKLFEMERETIRVLQGNENNYELRIFYFLVLAYLYNLEVDDKYDEAEVVVESIKLQFPEEYRTYWFNGYFLAAAALPMRGYYEIKKVFDMVSENKLPAAFFEEYAFICMLLNMEKTAIYSYEQAARISGRPLSEYPLHASLNNIFSPADPRTDYDVQTIWSLVEIEDGYRLISRIFGVSIPLLWEWHPQIIPMTNRLVILPLMVEGFGNPDVGGVGIGYNFFLSPSPEGINSFKNTLGRETTVIVENKKITINGIEFDAYFYEDPTYYPHLGGGKGCYLFATLPYPQKPGQKIEYPDQSVKESGYFMFMPRPDRYKQNVYVCIMMDSCDVAYEKSLVFLYDFLNQCVFE